MKKFLLLLVVVCSLFTSCYKDDTPAPNIEFENQIIETDFEPGRYFVKVSSTRSWVASTEDEWIVIEKESGEIGDSEVEFSVKRNEEMSEREGCITLVNASSNLVAELIVKQKAFVPSIKYPENLVFAVEGGSKKMNIEANTTYEVSVEYAEQTTEDWVTVEKLNEGKSIRVVVTPHAEASERNANVILRNEKYDYSVAIEVGQSAFVPQITINHEQLEYPFEGETKEIVVESNFDFEVNENVDWIELPKEGSEAETASVTLEDIALRTTKVKIKVNPSVESSARSATLVILNSKYNVTREVTISQAALVANAPNVIVYTSSDANIVAVNKIFRSDIVENTYKDGRGVIILAAADSVVVDSAFRNIQNLTSITLPNGVKTLEPSVFRDCSKLEEVTLPATITSLGDYLFSGCTSLEVIDIPENVVEIGDGVFSSCKTLVDVKIPHGVKEVKVSTFQNCTNLTSVTIPETVEKIGDWAFYNCSKLPKINIPNSVVSVGQSAFYYCKALQSFAFPEKITKIAASTLFGCSQLNSVVIPAKVASIEDEAFKNCYNLSSVNMPEGLNAIGKSVFSGCESLLSVVIPESVSAIGDYAFYNCSGLESIYCKPKSVPVGGLCMFDGNAANRQIMVPASAVEAYKVARNWANYSASFSAE